MPVSGVSVPPFLGHALDVVKIVFVPEIDAGTFDGQHPRYRCFCQSVHAKPAVLIVGLIETIVLIMNLIPHLNAGHFWSIVFFLIWAATLVCLFRAIQAELSILLIPLIVFQALVIGTYLILCLLLLGDSSLGKVFKVSAKLDSPFGLFIPVYILVLSIVLPLIPIVWFFSVLLTGYRYLRDKAKHEAEIAAMAEQAAQSSSNGANNEGFTELPPAYANAV